DRALTKLQRRLDLVETKKGIQLNVNELENASKSLNKVIECQIVDNCKKGLGYNAVPPPHTGLFPPLKSDLSSTGDAPIIKDWVSDDEEEEVEKQEVKPSINRINFVKATTDNNPKETVKTGEQPKQNTHRKRAIKNSYDNKKVKTIWVKKVNTAKLKAAVNAAKTKAKYNVVKGKSGNAIKASTCWVWKTKHNVLDHVSRHDNASITLKKFDYVDARGYEEIDEGYVAFGRNLQGGKITGKVSPIPTTRIHKHHPLEQVIGDLHSAPQTRRMLKNLEEHGLVGTVILRTDNKDLQYCLFACFLS
nr:hypothetical protein [Tanacetum cinerariifolium]